MLHITTTPAERRKQFRDALATGKLQRFAGAFSPFVAMLMALALLADRRPRVAID
jgi:methylisocitrate lyase